MFLCLCGIISVMMTRVLTGLLTFVVPYSMTGSFVFAFVCLFVWTHSVLRRAMSVPYGVQEQLANVRLYSCTTKAKMTMMYCLFVYLLLCVNTIINVWLGSLWSCLPLEIRKGCKHYCCHPLQFHKIYESPINRAVCQLSSIPGATAQLIACTWATKVFSQS